VVHKPSRALGPKVHMKVEQMALVAHFARIVLPQHVKRVGGQHEYGYFLDFHLLDRRQHGQCLLQRNLGHG